MTETEEKFMTALVFRGECSPEFQKKPLGFLLRALASARKLASRARSIEVRLCNDPKYQALEQCAGYPARDRVERQLKALEDETGLRFKYDSDPRGYVVYLRTPNTKERNSMNGHWGL